GRTCIVTVAVTGVILTVMRVPSLRTLWTTTFGIVWIVKISLFVVMVAIAAIATTWLNRRMREAQSELTEASLSPADGKNGRPANLIFEGELYDISESKLWAKGIHMGRHYAGSDLTEAIADAPHGPEVLERVKKLGPAPAFKKETVSHAPRIFVVLAYAVLGVMLAILLCVSYWNWGPPFMVFRSDSKIAEKAKACVECHRLETPGYFADWEYSLHAKTNVTCLHCHRADEGDEDVSREHFKQYERADREYGTEAYRTPVSAVVTPRDCSRCHPREVEQYGRSKHANTMEILWKIDPWLNKGMNSDLERAAGCYHCHGTILRTIDGQLDPETWPNVGVGRINLDGSKGSCTSCHTRHRFSVMESRKPEACGQCHLGPDHPQIEIYMESKHGDIYRAFGDQYNWDAPLGRWKPGIDYRAPTCAACHMSGSGSVLTSHDVTERLAWEIQAPLTIRPSDFKPFPAKTNHEVERQKMTEICMQCHGKTWVDGHFAKLDKVVQEYNDVYFKPAKAMLDDLYGKGLLDKTRFFDERLEVEYYELWHHEGRRARMGAAMMAPDYTWWHGFYECKKRYNNYMEEARDLIKHNEKAYKATDFPNATGNTTRPPEVFSKGK
ncbi:MAG: CopD family protein, partial [Deltaproteobacteria bacterium]|nr:CopD family protein [Deltaproteobacteria bacterium]